MPPAPRSRLRSVLMGLALAAALAAICWKGARLLSDPTVLPPDDFVEYWAAGRLNALGQNPFEGSLLLPLEREAGRDTDEPVMMWNPPWTLSLAMPVGLLPARIAQLLWLAVSLLLVVACADRLWLVYEGPAGGLPNSWRPALYRRLHASRTDRPVILSGLKHLIAERVGLLARWNGVW